MSSGCGCPIEVWWRLWRLLSIFLYQAICQITLSYSWVSELMGLSATVRLRSPFGTQFVSQSLIGTYVCTSWLLHRGQRQVDIASAHMPMAIHRAEIGTRKRLMNRGLVNRDRFTSTWPKLRLLVWKLWGCFCFVSRQYVQLTNVIAL